MQRLEVSGAVRSLQWSLGVKGLRLSLFSAQNVNTQRTASIQPLTPYLIQIYVRLLPSSDAMQSLTAGQTLEISKDNLRRCLWHRTSYDDVCVNVRTLCDASVLKALQVHPTKIHSHDDVRQVASQFPSFQGPRQNVAVYTTPHWGTEWTKRKFHIVTSYLNAKQMELKMCKKFVVGD